MSSNEEYHAIGSRVTKRTSSGGGASRPSSTASQPINTNAAKKNASIESSKTNNISLADASKDVGFSGGIPLNLSSITGPVIFNDNPDPGQAPYVVPGERATREQNTYLEGRTITAISQPDSALRRRTNWGFRFHYAPETISESVQTNYTLVPDQGDVGNVLGTGLGAMSFKFLINRMEDVANHRDLHVPMLGKRNFYDLGTMYDIEFLYRTINGDPQSTGIVKHGPAAADPNGTANLGFLYMTAVEIRFNNIRFKGFITSLDFEHIMFSDKMVPILTYVTVSATRYLSGSALPTTAGDPPPATAGPVKAAPKKNKSVTVGKGGFSPGVKIPIPNIDLNGPFRSGNGI